MKSNKFPKNFLGQELSVAKLNRLKKIIKETKPNIRERIANKVCHKFNWYNKLGNPKMMSCKVSLLRLHRKGLIELPKPTRKNGNGKNYKINKLSLKEKTITRSVDKLEKIRLISVESRKESMFWNDLIGNYHYLGYKPLVGHQKRYIIYSGDILLGAIGFSSSAWKLEDRDNWIGWNIKTRKDNLYKIVNNSRFLILPWIKSKNLASKILSLCSSQITKDYYELYGYKPVLLETFVERDKFAGTCYKAANWTDVGKTKGRGKLDTKNESKLPQKEIFVYPLMEKFRKELGVIS